MRSPRVIVITGATAGVGRATAREFAREGARIALIARSRERLETTRREVEELGGEALCFPVDVADANGVEAAARRIEEAWGCIDVWINNAMVSVFSPVKEMRAEEFRRVTEVTYLGYVHGTLAALKRMLSRNRGMIIQVGSALAYRSIPLQSAYCAAKHAIVGFSESLRCELLHDRSRVRVCSAHLPAMNTPQFDWTLSRLPRRPQPVPPIFQPEIAARSIHWLSKHPRREIWMGGPTVVAIMAERIFPWLADRFLGRNGYRAQQTSEPADPEQPFNLWEPVAGDSGARGRFGNRARGFSLEAEVAGHRSFVFLLGLALGVAALTKIAFFDIENPSEDRYRSRA